MIVPYWPEPLVPEYKSGRYGKWVCKRAPAVKIPGYFSIRPYQSPGWRFIRDGVVWMSVTCMETESQMHHIAAAHGNVVIAGLGMGFVLYNIMRKPEVTSVTLLEKDPEVVKLLDRCSDWRAWYGHEKVELVMGDACEYVPNKPIDFLYADIWPHVGDDDALPLTKQMQTNINAKSVGFWTQEFDFIEYCRQHNIKHDAINRRAYREFAKSVDLPLTEQNSHVYPRLAFLSVTIQTALACSKKDRDLQLALLDTAMSLAREEILFT